ncbi:MAG: diguanylate cyclase [Aquabacterium sp.]
MQSFRTQIALLFGITAMAVILLISAITTRMLSGHVAKEQGEALQTLAQSTAVLLGEGLHERLREIELMADGFGASGESLDAPVVRQTLDRAQKTRQQYSWIGLTTPDGLVRTATQDMLIHKDVSARPWFQQALNGPHVGDVHEAKLLAKVLPAAHNGEPLRFVDFAAPVRGINGVVNGVLGAHADFAWVREVIGSLRSESARNVGVRIFILDQAGKVIHRPSGPEGLIGPASGAIVPQGHGIFAWSDGERYLTATARVNHPDERTRLGWTVVVRQPEALALNAASQASRTMLAMGLICSLLVMALAWGFAGDVSRPLRRLTEAAARIRGGELSANLPEVAGSRELRDLSLSLREMTQSMQQSQKDLAQANLGLEEKVRERTRELERANAELAHLARKDGLTGLYNRRAADDRMDEECARHQRYGQAFSLLLLDIDHFKRINDSFGHAVGDEALRHVAHCLTALCRDADFVARFGGEEFLVLLPQTHLEGAVQAGEKLRLAIAALDVPQVGHVTVSIGAAELSGGMPTSLRDLLKRADDALYEAKAGGRNRVVAAPAPQQGPRTASSLEDAAVQA